MWINTIFLKKFLFVSGVLPLIAWPIFVSKKDSFSPQSFFVSNFKKKEFSENIGDIYKGEKFTDFVEKILSKSDAKEKIQTFFTEELLKEELFSNSFFNLDKKKILEEEENKFNEEVKKLKDYKNEQNVSKQNKIFDFYGGSRKNMKDKYLNNESFNVFKKYILNFNQSNFSLLEEKNNDDTKNNTKFLTPNHTFNKEALNKKENWKNISFFYKKNNYENFKNEQEKNFILGKFNFINWAFKNWFDKEMPHYTWMALWKYDDTFNKEKFFEFYNEEPLKEKIEKKVNYKFPLFTQSSEKFKKFIKNLESFTTSQDNKTFIPQEYTDDSSTSLFSTMTEAHTGLYNEFASALSYQYNNFLDLSQTQNPLVADPSSPKKNKKIKSIELEKLKAFNSPIEAFIEKFDNDEDVKDNIQIDSSILKLTENEKNKKIIIHDAVEIKDKNWILIRNQAGVHALKIDGIENSSSTEQESAKLTNFFNYFKFRNLELIEKNNLSLSKTLNFQQNPAINKFHNFLSKNFISLIINYFFEEQTNKKNLFLNLNENKNTYFQKFKELLTTINNQNLIKEKYNIIFNLRNAIIDNYSLRELQDEKKFSLTEGLSSTHPYKTISNDETPLFFEEQIFKNFKYKKVEENTKNQEYEKLFDEYEKYENQYQTQVKTLMSELSVGIDSSMPFFVQSDRLFANNFVVNSTIDNLLNNKTLLQTLLVEKSFKKENSYIKDLYEKNIINKDNFWLATPNVLDSQEQTQSQSDNQETNSKWFDSYSIDDKQKEHILKHWHLKNLLLNNKNIFSLLRYKNYFNDKENDTNFKFQDWVIKHSEFFFKQTNAFQNSELKNYYNFLISFNYLTKNNFANLWQYFKNKIPKKDDSYLVFVKNKKIINNFSDLKLKKTFSFIPEKNYKNFLENIFSFEFKETTETANTEIEVDLKVEEEITLEMEEEKEEDISDSKQYYFLDLYITNSSKQWTNNISLDNNLVKTSNLFSFSKRENLLSYIDNLNNSDNLNSFVNFLKQKFPTWNLSPAQISSIQISSENPTSKTAPKSPKIKRIYLEDKKNALKEFLKDSQIPKISEPISQLEANALYNWTTEPILDVAGVSNPASIAGTSTSKSSKSVLDNAFDRKIIKKDNFYLIPINFDDFSSAEKFKEFVNKNLEEKIFLNFLFNLTFNKQIQEDAKNNFFLLNEKMSIFDQKLNNIIDSKWKS